MRDNEKAPCFGCSDRFVGCHSVCERYKEFAARNEKFVNYRLEQVKKNRIVLGYVNRIHEKISRESNRR